MKKFVLAAIAALSLGVGAASAQSLTHSAPPQNNGAQTSHPVFNFGGDGAAG